MCVGLLIFNFALFLLKFIFLFHIKPGIPGREMECGERGKWRKCYTPGYVTKYSGECPQIFRVVAKYSKKCHQTFWVMLPNISRNVLKHSGKFLQIFRGMSSNILGNALKAFGGMSQNIPGNVAKHSGECR